MRFFGDTMRNSGVLDGGWERNIPGGYITWGPVRDRRIRWAFTSTGRLGGGSFVRLVPVWRFPLCLCNYRR
jgi:hypothetical protein